MSEEQVSAVGGAEVESAASPAVSDIKQAQVNAFAKTLGYDVPEEEAPAAPVEAPSEDEDGETVPSVDPAKAEAQRRYLERKGTKRKLEEANQKLAQMEQQQAQITAYLQAQQQAALQNQQAWAAQHQQAPAPPPPPASLPDDDLLDSDPASYIKQMKQAVAEQKAWKDQLETRQQQYAQQLQQQQSLNQFLGALGQAEAQFSQTTPDYQEVYQALKTKEVQKQVRLGYSEQQANEMTQAAIFREMGTAMQMGRNPIEHIYRVAREELGRLPQKAEDLAFAAARAAMQSGDAGTIATSNSNSPAMPSPTQIASQGLNRQQIQKMRREVGLEGVLKSMERAQRIQNHR